MARKNRLNLKSNFRTGDRPTQEDFGDVFDSYVNFVDDKVSVDESNNLTIGGALTLTSNGNEPTEPGTIRWNSSTGEFEGYNGSEWGPLGGGESPWLKESGNLLYDEGNVGIGVSGDIEDKLEVELGPNEKSRFGTVALGPGSGLSLRKHAVFSHTNLRGSDQYALAQSESGKLVVNCPSSEAITFAMGNMAIGAWVNKNLVVGSSSQLDGASEMYKLQVDGNAFKSQGGDAWNNLSDIRTKKNVQQFTRGLDVLKNINPIRFSYNGMYGTPAEEEEIGISAQEIEEIFPSMVKKIELKEEKSSGDATEVLTTNLSALKFIMVNAIKELDKRLEKLENQSNNQSNNNMD